MRVRLSFIAGRGGGRRIYLDPPPPSFPGAVVFFWFPLTGSQFSIVGPLRSVSDNWFPSVPLKIMWSPKYPTPPPPALLDKYWLVPKNNTDRWTSTVRMWNTITPSFSGLTEILWMSPKSMLYFVRRDLGSNTSISVSEMVKMWGTAWKKRNDKTWKLQLTCMSVKYFHAEFVPN